MVTSTFSNRQYDDAIPPMPQDFDVMPDFVRIYGVAIETAFTKLDV